MSEEKILVDLEGGSDKTRGEEIIRREQKGKVGSGKATVSAPSGMQLSFFQLDDPVLEQIRDEVKTLDINNLTPLEALNKLNEIKKLVGGK